MIQMTSHRHLFRLLALATLLLAGTCLVGCGFFAAAAQRSVGTKVSAPYHGLANHSVAVVVYEDSSTAFMYPQARREVASFVSREIQDKIPTAKVLDYNLVLQYQDQTPSWDALPIKTIGKHFGVDRVLYLELTDYSTHAAGAEHLLQGHIAANVMVYDTTMPSDGRVFSQTVAASWPRGGPEPVLNNDDNLVRMRTLDAFAGKLIKLFVDWRDYGMGNNE